MNFYPLYILVQLVDYIKGKNYVDLTSYVSPWVFNLFYQALIVVIPYAKLLQVLSFFVGSDGILLENCVLGFLMLFKSQR